MKKLFKAKTKTRKVFLDYSVKHFLNTIRRAIFIALLFFIVPKVNGEIFDVRALWVVRDHIITKEKIDEVLSFADSNNYNHLFVQIRGRGDAYYVSKIVPRSHLLSNTNFDPLAYILKESSKYNLKIHVWINIYYLWSSPKVPSQSDHILFSHPEWLDTKTPENINIGETLNKMKMRKDWNGEGFFLAPTHPEVEAHLQNVITELLQNYKLDGIHYDYIRYHDLEWGLNPVGLKYFLNYNNTIPGLPSLEVKEKPTFSDFRRSAITNFVKKASLRIKAYQPDCIISAAVKPNLISAQNTFGQEWDEWLKKDYIDWAVPMNYTSDNSIFEKNIRSMVESIPEKFLENIIMGIGVYNQNVRSSGQKIYKTSKYDFGGISIFSYTVFNKEPIYASRLIKYLK